MEPATQSFDFYNLGSYLADRYDFSKIGHILTAVISSALHIFQIIGALLTIVLIVAGVFVLKKMRELNTPATAEPQMTKEELKHPPVPAPQGQLATRWQDVLRALESNIDSDWKLAILEADKLIDLVLKEKGYPGDGLGDRLMNMGPGDLASLDGIWEAHKIRNRIAHDVGYMLRHGEAKRAINLFEAALHELEVI